MSALDPMHVQPSTAIRRERGLKDARGGKPPLSRDAQYLIGYEAGRRLLGDTAPGINFGRPAWVIAAMSDPATEVEVRAFREVVEADEANADFDFRELAPLSELIEPGAANENSIDVYALAFALARIEVEIDPTYFGYCTAVVSDEELDARAERFKHHYLGRAKQLFHHASRA